LRIRELARSRVRYGYRRIQVLLKREGIRVNKKRVYRLYCEEGLQLRARRRRRHVTAATRRSPATRPLAPNVAWSMDFVSDQTAAGARFRALSVVDVFTRECLAIEPGQKLGAADVVNVLSRNATERGVPKRIHCGSEFAGSSR
jgi:putative transposase